MGIIHNEIHVHHSIDKLAPKRHLVYRDHLNSETTLYVWPFIGVSNIV